MAAEIFEVRDYHYAGDLAEYRAWWAEALPVLRRSFDIVGVWTDFGEPARISGATPMDLPLGSANATWMIRWSDLDGRERAWAELADDEQWKAIAERHPGWDDYLHMSVRFLEPVG